jgi:hypothetical protein
MTRPSTARVSCGPCWPSLYCSRLCEHTTHSLTLSYGIALTLPLQHTMASCRIQWLYLAVHGCKTYLNLNLRESVRMLRGWRAQRQSGVNDVTVHATLTWPSHCRGRGRSPLVSGAPSSMRIGGLLRHWRMACKLGRTITHFKSTSAKHERTTTTMGSVQNRPDQHASFRA